MPWWHFMHWAISPVLSPSYLPPLTSGISMRCKWSAQVNSCKEAVYVAVHKWILRVSCVHFYISVIQAEHPQLDTSKSKGLQNGKLFKHGCDRVSVKFHVWPGVMDHTKLWQILRLVIIHAFNPSSGEVEAGRLVSEFESSQVYRVSSRTTQRNPKKQGYTEKPCPGVKKKKKRRK